MNVWFLSVQIIVNGGSRQGQTSTALMVLLLSTALFLIPGVRDQVTLTLYLVITILVPTTERETHASNFEPLKSEGKMGLKFVVFCIRPTLAGIYVLESALML